METVDKRTYYHLQRINHLNENWKCGQIINFNKDKLNYYSSSMKEQLDRDLGDYIFRKKIDFKTDINELYHRIIDKDLYQIIDEGEDRFWDIQQTCNYLEVFTGKAVNAIESYLKVQQELIFESVRKKTNADLPSRMNCIWVTKTKKELSKWCGIFESYQILKLELKGNIHKTDGKCIDTKKNQSLYNCFNSAIDYWNGEFNSNDEIEYLFEGEVKILDIEVV